MRKTPYTARAYRALAPRPDEAVFRAVVEESDLWINCGRNYFAAAGDLPDRVSRKLREVRSIIKAWLRLQPEFGPSLRPVAVPESAPPLIKSMARAGERWRVGPMAAVAGAVAEEVARAFMAEAPDFLVENGGDIFMASTRERVAALLPRPEEAAHVGIRLAAPLFPLAVCSSSSTIGHSLSFGNGELVTVVSRDAALADAAATSLCNRLKTPRDLERIVKEAEADPEVIGLFAQCGGAVGLWGEIELVVIGHKD